MYEKAINTRFEGLWGLTTTCSWTKYKRIVKFGEFTIIHSTQLSNCSVLASKGADEIQYSHIWTFLRSSSLGPKTYSALIDRHLQGPSKFEQ